MALTQRQLEIVCFLANGYRIDEIAEELHFSVSSVNTTLGRARKRAGARSNPHLVSIAIASGDLTWNPQDEMRYANSNGNSSDK